MSRLVRRRRCSLPWLKSRRDTGAADPAHARSSRRQGLLVPPKPSCLSSFGSLRASFPKLYQRSIMRPNDAEVQISTNVRFAPEAVVRIRSRERLSLRLRGDDLTIALGLLRS